MGNQVTGAQTTNMQQQDLKDMNNREFTSFNGMCGIECIEADIVHSVFQMQIKPHLCQPYGYLHGGATITLLESAASRCASERAAKDELPFGVNVNIWHKNPGKAGIVTATAYLDHEEERLSGAGRKQFWTVRAFDEDGKTISEGVVMTMIVPKCYLEEKGR